MATCLAALPNLKTLFLTLESDYIPSFPSPPLARANLPALTRFNFDGDNRYLEELVARIDAPSLRRLVVTFAMDPNFSASQFYRFISRSQLLKESHHARVDLNCWSFGIYNRSGNHLRLYTHSTMSGRRISSTARLCNDISPLLSQVESLNIYGKARPQLELQDKMASMQWLNFFRPFTAVECLFVSQGLVPVVAHALRELAGERATEVLPVLRSLFFEGLDTCRSVQEVIEPFLATRRLSDRPVALCDGIKL